MLQSTPSGASAHPWSGEQKGKKHKEEGWFLWVRENQGPVETERALRGRDSAVQEEEHRIQSHETGVPTSALPFTSGKTWSHQVSVFCAFQNPSRQASHLSGATAVSRIWESLKHELTQLFVHLGWIPLGSESLQGTVDSSQRGLNPPKHQGLPN